MNFPGQENYVSDNSDSAVNLKIISADRNHAASQNPVCTLQIYVIYKSENQLKLTAAASNKNKKFFVRFINEAPGVNNLPSSSGKRQRKASRD